MGLFFTPKPKVTRLEFHKVRTYLFSAGFTHRELDEVEEIFRANLDKKEIYGQGITKDDLDNGIKWMRANMHIHHIPSSQIDILERELRAKL
jgi:hypothetical protein